MASAVTVNMLSLLQLQFMFYLIRLRDGPFYFSEGRLGSFVLLRLFFAFGLCKNFFQRLKVVRDFFFPSFFSLHIYFKNVSLEKNRMEQKMIRVPQALLSLQADTSCI